jgi:hypothetical protein
MYIFDLFIYSSNYYLFVHAILDFGSNSEFSNDDGLKFRPMDNAEQLAEMRDYHEKCKEPIKALIDEVKKTEAVGSLSFFLLDNDPFYVFFCESEKIIYMRILHNTLLT